ncbi:MAG: elongation factor G [Bacteroidetes bacterium GWE2_39_28]|nr:MAG: elongation factor G [Bacteroidetes bacterium GWE2_39_28]OFY12044.1 MAG: elongation factor G [Bacteroidetes bacterium GWF2_39_10]OFZ09018.1 MAG: elongation factor G [Bacteroidetes bacterium RIFOXYB2_FULL_39_7]HCT95152.1 elongation factor G [Rikenellaceae bacterium]
MKVYPTQSIRNVVLLGNTKSGKTTLAETMLFEGKVIDRRGSVEAKTTVSDNSEIEQIYQRSIYPALLYTEFMDNKLNIIDTPGSDDFVGGVISAFKVADTGVMIVNAQQGVEVGTEILARYAEKHSKPLILGVNQLDHEKANWEGALESLKQTFGKKVVIIQFPIDAGLNFNSFIDVLKMKMYVFKDENGTREEHDIPSDLADQAAEYHQELAEMAAENDEALMEAFFDKGQLSEEEIRKGLSIGLSKCEIMPIFCLSAKKDIGVKRLMEFIINVAPNPDKMVQKLKTGETVPCEATGQTSLFIYKTAIEQHLGEVSYFRVMSGKLTEGMDVVNHETGAKERISTIYAVAGKKRDKLTEIVAGDIGCTVKLKSVKTNQTLNAGPKEWAFEPIVFPPSKFRTAIKAKQEKDEEKLGELLNKAHAEDPTIRIEYSKELKQTILSGQGEHHINILKWHLTNTNKIEVDLFAPKIPYRETITKVALADYRHRKQSGGAGQFGEVHILIEPVVEGVPAGNRFKAEGKELVLNLKGKEEFTMDWGGKLEYYNCIVGGAIDARFMPAILKGIMEKMEEGPLTGSYARDIRVFVYDGKMHPVDSNEISFKLAGRNAFKEAFKKAGPKIMEPIYNVEVLVPSEHMGDVMSDLQNRRAMIEGMSSEKGFEVLKARVPLAELHKYSTTLSSLTSGRATFTMTYADYQQVPAEVQDKLLKDYEASEKDE